MRKTIPFSTSNYNGCGLASKTNQISARHLGLRDLVLQVEDLRFYFAGATTQRLKTSLYTVVRRGSTAIVHCFAPRFYRGCPRFYCNGCDRSSPAFIRDYILSHFSGTVPASAGLHPLPRDYSRLDGNPPVFYGDSPAAAGCLHVVRRQRGVVDTSIGVSCGERIVRFEHRDRSFPIGVHEFPVLYLSVFLPGKPGTINSRSGTWFSPWSTDIQV